MALTNEQYVGLFIVTAIVLWWYNKSTENFDATTDVVSTVTPQKTLLGSNLPSGGITLSDGTAPASLQIFTETELLPYNNWTVGDHWADITISGDTHDQGALASGQPMPVTTIPTSGTPMYSINVPPIAPPLNLPQEMGSTGNTVTNTITQSGPNVKVVPHEANKSFNRITDTDFSGNDLACLLYGSDVTDSTGCQTACQDDKKCVGYSAVGPGVSPILPQGFCCLKHTMADAMATTGIDSYKKMSMAPM